MKHASRLWALPIAAALALSALVPALASVPAVQPAANAAQATATPAPIPTRSLDDLARVRSTKKLLVGVSADYPPYSFYNSDFKIDGFEPALIGDLAERLGATSELNDFAFEGLLAALQLGQVDVAIAAISDTAERRQNVDFTNTYFIGADGLLGPRNAAKVSSVEDLAGKRVGAEKGTVYATWMKENLVDKGLSDATDIFLYPDISNGVRDLKEGKIDYLLLDRLPARNFAEAENLTVVSEDNVPQRFAMAVRKGSNLRPALNDALLKAQNDGTVAELINQYLGLASDEVEPITPEPTPVATVAPQPTPTGPPPCVNGAAYVADLNYDDQNMTAPPVMQPGQSFRKGWRMRNSGNCNWNAAFYIGFVFGNTPAAQMGGQPTVVGRVVAPNQTADLFVNLVAPGQPGTYQGFWQMFDNNGTPFGERVWVGITVPNPNPPTPVPPTPVPGITFTANPSTINQGQCSTVSWSVQNVNGVWFYAQGQAWQNNGVPGVSSQQVCPQQTTTYFLRVQFNNGAVQQSQLTVNVVPAGPGGPVITQFNVNPTQISAGQCVQVAWVVEGAVSRVAILSNGTVRWDGAPASGNWHDCPQTPGTVQYSIQAFGTDGQMVQTSRDVNVGQPGAQPPVINSFTADSSNVAYPGVITLRWDVGGGATRIEINRNYGTVTPLPVNGNALNGYLYDSTQTFFNAAGGTQQVGYVLNACNAQGQCVSRDLVVTVQVAAP